ncbi:response regulator [Methylobacterium sp.]|uniref:response regulator n=1 Tax=Methylobacterium sp. TaxID=409 RepID=UPI0025FDD6A4|nr:response regulator [Methylobacterium sp.]
MTSDVDDATTRPVVLVVQDEPILAMVMSDFVEEAGCQAVVATSTASAIQILEARADIHVVFADLDVRGSVMGLTLMAMIRDRWPPIELVMTGALRPDVARIPARGIFCDKPFRGDRVVEAVRKFAA